jgi:hypothetical protein
MYLVKSHFCPRDADLPFQNLTELSRGKCPVSVEQPSTATSAHQLDDNDSLWIWSHEAESSKTTRVQHLLNSQLAGAGSSG